MMGCARNFTFNISRLLADFVQRGKGHLFSSIYKYFYNVPRQSTAQQHTNSACILLAKVHNYGWTLNKFTVGICRSPTAPHPGPGTGIGAG